MQSTRSTTPLVASPLTVQQQLQQQQQQQQQKQQLHQQQQPSAQPPVNNHQPQQQQQPQLRSSSSPSSARLLRVNEVQYEDNTTECVDKYKEQFLFLRDARFLRDLENDSVDSDIIEEELRALQQGPIRTRDKVVKFLQSNPVQILLCVIVLLDAGIVIAQILLDLNSVKEKLTHCEAQLDELMFYIRDTHADRLLGYDGKDVDVVLSILRRHETMTFSGFSASSTTTSSTLPSSYTPHIPSSTIHPDGRVHVERDDVTFNVNTSRYNRSMDGRIANQTWRQAVGKGHGEGGEKITLDESGMSNTDVAHILHFASIAMLGVLVVEDLVKIIAMGKSFFKHKIEIFDAIIIGASFSIDIIFFGGVSGEEGQKAAAVLVVLLLWRIARVVDGIVITVKQRQEFRIRLQKRARRTAEKKLEMFEEERSTRTKQIEALKDLCNKAGINEADIAACTPKQHRQLSATLGALSSVARLSVSMTMLMSSGGHRGLGLTGLGAEGGVKGRLGGVGLRGIAGPCRSPHEDRRNIGSLIRDRGGVITTPARIESLPNIQREQLQRELLQQQQPRAVVSSPIDVAGNRRKAFGGSKSSSEQRKPGIGGIRGPRHPLSASDVTTEESTTSSTSSLALFSAAPTPKRTDGSNGAATTTTTTTTTDSGGSKKGAQVAIAVDPSGPAAVPIERISTPPNLSSNSSPVNSSGVKIFIQRTSDDSDEQDGGMSSGQLVVGCPSSSVVIGKEVTTGTLPPKGSRPTLSHTDELMADDDDDAENEINLKTLQDCRDSNSQMFLLSDMSI